MTDWILPYHVYSGHSNNADPDVDQSTCNSFKTTNNVVIFYFRIEESYFHFVSWLFWKQITLGLASMRSHFTTRPYSSYGCPLYGDGAARDVSTTPSQHNAFTQCSYKVGPASLPKHWVQVSCSHYDNRVPSIARDGIAVPVICPPSLYIIVASEHKSLPLIHWQPSSLNSLIVHSYLHRSNLIRFHGNICKPWRTYTFTLPS